MINLKGSCCHRLPLAKLDNCLLHFARRFVLLLHDANHCSDIADDLVLHAHGFFGPGAESLALHVVEDAHLEEALSCSCIANFLEVSLCKRHINCLLCLQVPLRLEEE